MENLLDIFQFALSLLSSIHQNDVLYTDEDYRSRVLVALFELLSKCLQFNFLGVTTDEGSDEIWVLQLPQTWEGLVCNANQLRIFFDMYVMMMMIVIIVIDDNNDNVD